MDESSLDSSQNTSPSTALKSEAKSSRSSVSRLAEQVQAAETKLNDLERRAETLDEMIAQIEHAHKTVDQLPTDLQSAADAQEKISGLLQEAERDRVQVLTVRKSADELDKKLKDSSAAADAVMTRCESAYAASTSLGLPAAFSERSTTLAISMWVWVVGLILALSAGVHFGSPELRDLIDQASAPNSSGKPVGLKIVLSVVSIGGPVWCAWLATKQIGQRFRLAEDYAFKASISRAYEGYRREAARVDQDLEARLLASALTRLDEQPLRLVETESHGSPWHELMVSETVRDALRSVPEFARKVVDLAKTALAKPPEPAE